MGCYLKKNVEVKDYICTEGMSLLEIIGKNNKIFPKIKPYAQKVNQNKLRIVFLDLLSLNLENEIFFEFINVTHTKRNGRKLKQTF